jgi:hypothetical protein
MSKLLNIFLLSFVAYSVIISASLIESCYAHNAPGYISITVIGCVGVTAGFVAALIYYVDLEKAAFHIGTLALMYFGLFCGFTSFATDNYCRVNENTIFNPTSSQMSDFQNYKFVFNENTFVLPKYVETVSYKGSTVRATVIAECPIGTSPDGFNDTLCPPISREKIKVVAFATKDTFNDYSWSNLVREAVRLRLYTSGYASEAVQTVKEKNSDIFIFPKGDAQNLAWRNFNDLENDTLEVFIPLFILSYLPLVIVASIALIYVVGKWKAAWRKKKTNVKQFNTETPNVCY